MISIGNIGFSQILTELPLIYHYAIGSSNCRANSTAKVEPLDRETEATTEGIRTTGKPEGKRSPEELKGWRVEGSGDPEVCGGGRAMTDEGRRRPEESYGCRTMVEPRDCRAGVELTG